MPFAHGSNSTLSVDGTAITSYTDQATLNRLQELAEVTSFGDDDKAYIGGLRGATVACSGSWDATGDAALWGTFDAAVVAIAYSPDAGTTSFTGNAFVTNYSITSGVGDKVSWSCSLTFSGAVSRA